MRRDDLVLPLRDGRAPGDPLESATGRDRRARLPVPPVRRLGPPRLATTRPRRFFDPSRGRLRAIHREVNLWASRRIWPRLPGIHRPYGLLLERQLTLSEATIRLAGLAAPLDGLTVLLVTDIHAGPFLSAGSLEAALARLLRVEPDLVLFGGDFADARLSDALPHLEAIRRVEAPLGVYGVLGNHDHYTGEAGRLRALLEAAGVRLLQNEAAPVGKDGAVLALAGVDDLVRGCPDLDAALASAAAAAPGAPVLLLSHNPDIFFEAARRGVGLVAAGHTHGGQIRPAGVPVLFRQSRYRLDEGRYRFGRSELVVSRGLGAAGLPLRWACPPEAVLLTLRS